MKTTFHRICASMILALGFTVLLVSSNVVLAATQKPSTKKVQLCHYPPDNPARVQQILVGASSVAEHLAHGDFQGSCAQDCRQNASVCNDSNVCSTDTCNTSNGTCGHTEVSCDDGSACTTDSCDAIKGCLNKTVSCDDGNACTDDTCNEIQGCQNSPVSCDDGEQCSTDACDPASGCTYGTVSCDDNNKCTIDSCTNDTGCTHQSVACNAGQTCDPGIGTCRTLPFTLAQTYENNCVPYNYLELKSTWVYPSFNDAYVACALLCESDTSCNQIWVSYSLDSNNNKIGPFWCMTGGGPENKQWNSNEIQCNYPPIGKYGDWYNKNP